MAKWIIISGMPNSGQDFIFEFIYPFFKSSAKCIDLGWYMHENQGYSFEYLDMENEVIFIRTSKYINGLSDFVPSGNLFVIISIRDIRDVFAQLIVNENKNFEDIFSSKENYSLINNLEKWKNIKKVFKLKFELLWGKDEFILRQILGFLSNNSESSIQELAGKEPEMNQYIHKFFNENKILGNQGYPEIWRKVLSRSEIAIIQYYSGKWLIEHGYSLEKSILHFKLIWKTHKIFKHLIRGSLIRRITDFKFQSSLRQLIKLESSEGGYIIKKIDRNIRLKLYKDSHLTSQIIEENFENSVQLFLKRYLNKGDIVIDVGANIGLYTVLGSKYVGYSGKIISIEPSENTFHRLQENIKLNKLINVTPLQLAMSDKSGESVLYSNDWDFDALNSIVPPRKGFFYKKEKIKTITLDSLISEYNLSTINLVKIDVEGWEIPVLKGGKNYLSQPGAPVLIVEFTEENAKNAGFSCQQLFELGKSLGYDWYSYDPVKNEMTKQHLKDNYPYENLYAIKHIEEVNTRLKNLFY